MIKRVTEDEANTIIDTRLPLGQFYCQEGNYFVGIDNRSGDAWTEDFLKKSSCTTWLKK